MRKLFAAILLLTTAMPAFAEDTPYVKLLGFSDNGRYMAFQDIVVTDGAGDRYSTVRILDTTTDKYVAAVKDFTEAPGDGPNVDFVPWTKKALAKAKETLDKYGIKESNGAVVHVSTAPRISTMIYNGKYVSLHLRTMPVNMAGDTQVSRDKLQERFELCESFSSDSERNPYPKENSLVGYEIFANEEDSPRPQVTLHSDKRVPLSRYCPYDYSINSAFAFGNKVVLLVSYNSYGFEGPDTNFITVPFDITALSL